MFHVCTQTFYILVPLLEKMSFEFSRFYCTFQVGHTVSSLIVRHVLGRCLSRRSVDITVRVPADGPHSSGDQFTDTLLFHSKVWPLWP